MMGVKYNTVFSMFSLSLLGIRPIAQSKQSTSSIFPPVFRSSVNFPSDPFVAHVTCSNKILIHINYRLTVPC